MSQFEGHVLLRGGLQPDEAIPFGRDENFSDVPKKIASSLSGRSSQ